ncbi:MAG: hypothetical protein AAF587_37375 [Bacteroidota bacterium]
MYAFRRFIRQSLLPSNLPKLRRVLTIFLCVALIPLTSCLDIKEKITLKRNGSGTYSIKVDMEEMMSMLQGFMSQDETGELNIFDTMDSTLREQVIQLRSVPGLTNVSHQSENFTFRISYDFDKVETLNEALSSGGSLGGNMGGLLPENIETGPAYHWTRKSFERRQESIQDFFEESDDDEMASMMSMAKMMMAEATYQIVYDMPGRVKKMTNSEAKLSSDKKTVSLDLALLDILEGNAELGNKITFKKR